MKWVVSRRVRREKMGNGSLGKKQGHMYAIYREWRL